MGFQKSIHNVQGGATMRNNIKGNKISTTTKTAKNSLQYKRETARQHLPSQFLLKTFWKKKKVLVSDLQANVPGSLIFISTKLETAQMHMDR